MLNPGITIHIQERILSFPSMPSALKRDEVYTFMAGFFVAANWLIFLTPCFPERYFQSPLLPYLALIIAWLLSTVAIYFLLHIINYCNRKEIRAELEKQLDLSEHSIRKFVNKDFIEFKSIEESYIASHIFQIIFIGFYLSIYPILKQQIFPVYTVHIGWQLLIYTFCGLIIWMFSWLYRKETYYVSECYWKRDIGCVEFYSEAAYAEKISEHLINQKYISIQYPPQQCGK